MNRVGARDPQVERDGVPVRVWSASVEAVAVRYTGFNDQVIKDVCQGSKPFSVNPWFIEPADLPAGSPPHARVFDARTNTWPPVAPGAWVVADGVGVLVLSDPWFRKLFGPEEDTDPLSGVDLALDRLRLAVDRVRGGRGQPGGVVDPAEEEVWSSPQWDGAVPSEAEFGQPFAPAAAIEGQAEQAAPWGPQALRPVPAPHPDALILLGDVWRDGHGRDYVVTEVGDTDVEAVVEMGGHRYRWSALMASPGLVNSLQLVHRVGFGRAAA